MLKQFTPDYIRANKGCYEFSEVDRLSFINKPTITIDDIINSEMPTKDKYWWVIKKCDLTIRQKQDLAIACAEIVLVVYENKYPEDKRPREAVQAAKDYLNGNINIDELRKKRAADADAAAAYAYADADAAAAYAYAAAAAAAADADAAAAYAYAAYAAADAADAAALKKALLDHLIEFVKNN